jgi:hypothetical protein
LIGRRDCILHVYTMWCRKGVEICVEMLTNLSSDVGRMKVDKSQVVSLTLYITVRYGSAC